MSEDVRDEIEGEEAAEAVSSPPAVDADASDPEEVVDPLAAAEARAAEYLDHARRLAAEFDNFRKRAARDHEAAAARATERIVQDLLPVLDDLIRADEALAERGDDVAVVRDGVALTLRNLRGTLERHGIGEIDPLGEPFDPHAHEALLQQPSDAPEGTVIQVLQRGYRSGERIVRPARVIVAAAEGA